MVNEHQRFVQTHRFGALDGLRAISVLAVVWHHTAGKTYEGFLGRGALGVDMFFAISGFLITTLLLRERSRTGGVSLRKFYARRTLRIFPVYYLVLLTYTVLVAVTRSGTSEADAFWHHLPAFATYTSNWFVDLSTDSNVTFYFAWSLATEEQFYLFWPPLLVLLLHWRQGRAGVAVLAIVILAAVTIAVDRGVRSDALAWRVVGSLAVPILLGAAAAILLHYRRSFDRLAPVLGQRFAAPVFGVGALVLVALGAPEEIVQLTMVLLIAACCVREDTWLHPVLTLRPLVFIGVISYGVYLMHMLAANLVRPAIGDQYGLLVFLATVPVVLLVAYLSFRFVEQPILARKRQYEVPESADDRQLADERG